MVTPETLHNPQLAMDYCHDFGHGKRRLSRSIYVFRRQTLLTDGCDNKHLESHHLDSYLCLWSCDWSNSVGCSEKSLVEDLDLGSSERIWLGFSLKHSLTVRAIDQNKQFSIRRDHRRESCLDAKRSTALHQDGSIFIRAVTQRHQSLLHLFDNADKFMIARAKIAKHGLFCGRAGRERPRGEEGFIFPGRESIHCCLPRGRG